MVSKTRMLDLVKALDAAVAARAPGKSWSGAAAWRRLDAILFDADGVL